MNYPDPIEILDPVRWRRPWALWHAPIVPGLNHLPRPRLLAELRAVACETRKRTVNGLDTDDQHWHATNLRRALSELN